MSPTKDPPDEKDKKIEELERENNVLRGLVANSELPCVYCKLPAADMKRCQFGFPGCSRMDDIVNDPNFVHPDDGGPE